jgi:hypothetical protein
MPFVAILAKAAALAVLLVCSADTLKRDGPSSPRRDPAATISAAATKAIPLHCRRTFGCAPVANITARQVQQ